MKREIIGLKIGPDGSEASVSIDARIMLDLWIYRAVYTQACRLDCQADEIRTYWEIQFALTSFMDSLCRKS